jgi:hypothetical protein
VDWNFYGSARMATFYVSDDFGDGALVTTGADDDDGTQWDLQGNSRFGATVKGENISGRIEMGMTDAVPGGGNVSSRRVYGEWDFGAGKLKVGKDYTPVSQFISTQTFGADLGLLGIGTYYGLRQGQIALSMGSFQIAAITQTEGQVVSFAGLPNVNCPTATAVVNTTVGDPDSYFPKIEAKWGMAFDAFNFNLMGGFQYFELEDVVSGVDGTTNDIDVTSWVLGADAGFSFGPAYIKGAISYDQNGGNAGWYSVPGGWDGDDDMNDTNVLQGALVGGFKMSDMVSFEVGWGMAMTDNEANAWDDDTLAWSAYGNATIALAPGVYVIPEVGYFDWDETGLDAANQDLGNEFYLGAKWQIDF